METKDYTKPALITAIEKNLDLDHINELITAGTNVNEQDSLGNTPLHYLIKLWRLVPSSVAAPALTNYFMPLRAKYYSILLMLLNAGADIMLPNSENKTPLELVNFAIDDDGKYLLNRAYILSTGLS
jgi:ankyrin repeat protein